MQFFYKSAFGINISIEPYVLLVRDWSVTEFVLIIPTSIRTYLPHYLCHSAIIIVNAEIIFGSSFPD